MPADSVSIDLENVIVLMHRKNGVVIGSELGSDTGSNVMILMHIVQH